MQKWWNLTERFLVFYSLYIYGRRALNMLVIGAIVSAAVTVIAAWLIYGLGWEAYLPINTTWVYADPVKRHIIEPQLIMGNSYLDSYNVFYHYPGYYFFTFFWTTSRYLPFYPGMVFIVMSTPAFSLMSAAAIRIVGQHLAKQRVIIGVTGIKSLRRLSKFLLVNSLYWLLIVVLVNTYFGIPLAVFIGFKYMFAGHAVLFEGASIKQALKRSSYLFDNNWARSTTYFVPLTVIAVLAAGGMALIPTWGSTAGVLLATLIPPVFLTVFYVERRIEKEAYTAEEFAIDLDAWAKGIKPLYPKRAKWDAEYGERQYRNKSRQ